MPPGRRLAWIRRRLVPVAAGVLVLFVAVAVHAHWTVDGSGTGSGSASTLDEPALAGQPGAGTATLTWTPVTPPGGGPAAYYVTRDGGGAGGDCPTAAAPSAALACTDSGLEKGTYAYTVTAVFNSWTAAAPTPTSVTLASGALHHLALAAASTTPTAGAADNLTITALDLYANTVTTYTGSHSLTFAGASAIGGNNPTVSNAAGAAVAFGSATSLTFSAGVATVSGSANGVMRLVKAETASITVSQGGSYTSTALAVTVSGASIASFTVPTPAAQVAGTPFTVSITAKDTYTNTATYTGSQCLAFSGPANSPGGTAPTYPARGACAAGQSAITFTAGVASSVSVTLANAASTTLTVTDAPSGKSGATGAFTVAAGALSRLWLALASTTPAVAAADNLTITAGDAYGNVLTSYAGSKNLTFSGASSSGGYSPTVTNAGGSAVAFGSATSITFTAGVATVSGSANGVMRLYRVETAAITVSEGGNYTSTALSVTPALPAGLGVKVQYRNHDAPNPVDFNVIPDLVVMNTGSVSMSLDLVTVRYWFTGDGGPTTYWTYCDYAYLGCSNLAKSVVPVSPPRTGADAYLEVTFAAGAGSLAVGGSTSDIMVRFNQYPWSVLTETNDWSYTSGTAYADNSKVTAYWYGNRVWGTEP